MVLPPALLPQPEPSPAGSLVPCTPLRSIISSKHPQQQRWERRGEAAPRDPEPGDTAGAQGVLEHERSTSLKTEILGQW